MTGTEAKETGLKLKTKPARNAIPIPAQLCVCKVAFNVAAFISNAGNNNTTASPIIKQQ